MKNNSEHNLVMHRCLRLAEQGTGYVAPNPLVGAVIVYDGKIIAEGYHQKYGEAHAEVNAINAVADKSYLAESTLYVNLEPCSHYGKTPPCSQLIIQHKIKKVVIGMQDPFGEVDGKGIQQLRNAGVEVVTDVLNDECKFLNRRFITFHEKRRPYIVLKWAESVDKFIGKENEKINISNALSKVYAHKFRTEEQAILIGATTAKSDNPRLNSREWSGPDPIRILIDNSNKLKNDLNLFDGKQKTFIASKNAAVNYPNTKLILITKEDFIFELLVELYHHGIQSVLVEGGSKTLQSFIDADLWDEAKVFQSKIILKNGIAAPEIKASLQNTNDLDGDLLIHYKNTFS